MLCPDVAMRGAYRGWGLEWWRSQPGGLGLAGLRDAELEAVRVSAAVSRQCAFVRWARTAHAQLLSQTYGLPRQGVHMGGFGTLH